METRSVSTRSNGRLALKDPGLVAWIRLARVYAAIDQRTARFLRQFDLTTAQFDLIAQIGAHEGATQTELAEALLVTKGNITQLLDRLEERGLIERRARSGRRGKAIFLTGAGWELNRLAVPAQEAHIAELFAPLGDEDQRELSRLLRHLETSLGDPGEGVES